MRLAMTDADTIEIDFELEDGKILTASLELGAQKAQKSHGLCRGMTPDIANLPAGEVYFVPEDANGQFPMKYEDGTLGVLEVKNRNIIHSTLIEGNQETIDAHTRRARIWHPSASRLGGGHPRRESVRHLPPRNWT
jgi:hypothetical protein